MGVGRPPPSLGIPPGPKTVDPSDAPTQKFSFRITPVGNKRGSRLVAEYAGIGRALGPKAVTITEAPARHFFKSCDGDYPPCAITKKKHENGTERGLSDGLGPERGLSQIGDFSVGQLWLRYPYVKVWYENIGFFGPLVFLSVPTI